MAPLPTCATVLRGNTVKLRWKAQQEICKILSLSEVGFSSQIIVVEGFHNYLWGGHLAQPNKVPSAHSGGPGSNTCLQPLTPGHDQGRLWEAGVMILVPMWDTWSEFPVPDFSPVPTWEGMWGI